MWGSRQSSTTTLVSFSLMTIKIADHLIGTEYPPLWLLRWVVIATKVLIERLQSWIRLPSPEHTRLSCRLIPPTRWHSMRVAGVSKSVILTHFGLVRIYQSFIRRLTPLGSGISQLWKGRVSVALYVLARLWWNCETFWRNLMPLLQNCELWK